MKKKLLALVLAGLLACVVAGCGGDGGSGTRFGENENGDFVIENDRGNWVMTSDLPAYIPYNGNSIPLIDVSFYEDYVDYSYTLFIVSTLDVSSLSDEDLHWLREGDLDVQAYITSEQNGYDFKSAVKLGSLFVSDEGKLIFVRTSSLSMEGRKSFAGSDVNISFDAKQDETYEYTNSDGKTSMLNKTEEVTYKSTVEDTVADLEAMDETLFKYVTGWLESRR